MFKNGWTYETGNSGLTARIFVVVSVKRGSILYLPPAFLTIASSAMIVFCRMSKMGGGVSWSQADSEGNTNRDPSCKARFGWYLENAPISFVSLRGVAELTQVPDGIDRVIHMQNLIVIECSVIESESV